MLGVWVPEVEAVGCPRFDLSLCFLPLDMVQNDELAGGTRPTLLPLATVRPCAAMPSSHPFAQYIEEHQTEIIKRLSDAVAIPSISADPEHRVDVFKMAA